ncbi:MAG: hypothetical protein U0892_19080 [Pirellulales bacterium]
MTIAADEQTHLISARPRTAAEKRRNLRKNRNAAYLGAALCCVLGGSVCAQDPFAADPFGAPPAAPAGQGSADAFGATPAAAPVAAGAAPTVLADDPDPMVRLLRANPPKTPHDIAEAIEWMSRVSRFDEVGRLIDSAQRSGWNQTQLLEFARTGGDALWYRLSSNTENGLNDAQKKFLRDAAALPSKVARDPQWIEGWIAKLASPSIVERHDAESHLHQAGSAAIVKLVTRLLAGDQSIPPNRIAEAIVHFDVDGIEALRTACTSTVPNAAVNVMAAISSTPSPEFSVELSSAAESVTLSQEARDLVRKLLLARHSTLPQPEAVHTYIVDRFKQQLDAYQLARQLHARAPASVWRLTPDGRSVVKVEVKAADRELERLSQLAQARAQLSRSEQLDLVQSATVLLQHHYQIGTAEALTDPAKMLSGLLPADTIHDELWSQISQQSSDWQMHGASLCAAAALGRSLPGAKPASPVFDFNAKLLRDERPALRYTATASVADAGIEFEFNGAATALENAVEMSRLGQGPMFLVVGLTAELRQAAEQQVGSLGGQAISANSTAEALKLLDRPLPIEHILVVDRVLSNSVSTLVGRLRNSRRGSSLPIAVLTDELTPVEVAELNRKNAVVQSVLTADAADLARVVAEMERMLDTRPLSSAERVYFSEVGSRLIETISADRKKFVFYPLQRWETELLVERSGITTSARLAALAGMGTSTSQTQLMLAAADTALDETRRGAAAAAFEQSVQRFGNRLSRTDTLRAYDLYNDLGPKDPVAVKALGKVLDAIEAVTGK